MSRKEPEMIQQNIEVSSELSRYLFEHAELDKAIPPDAEIILLPEFDTELKDFNLKLGRRLEAAGNKVVYLKIEGIRPQVLSRIEGVSF